MIALVINGSPKGQKSNTMKLTHAFLEGAQFEEVDIIDVATLNVEPCLGCFICWNKTPGRCVIRDDMDEVLQKIINADVLVWSFPLYYFSVPGALKTIIDRQLPMSLPFMDQSQASGGHPSRYDLSAQRQIIISTCGFWTARNNYDSVISMFDRFYGSDQYTKILCGQGELFRVSELREKTDAYLEIVREAGREFAVGQVSEKTKEKLGKPLYPREVFEKMADASWACEQRSGQPIDQSLAFTTQMAALYVPDGKERVLEMYYSDLQKTYQILLTEDGSQIITDDFKAYTTRVETPFSVWQAISRGEIGGSEALFQGKYQVLGDFDLMIKWDSLFSGQGNVEPQAKVSKVQKSNMLALLLPWLTIWIAMPIEPKLGAVLAIAVASLIPFMWQKYKAVFAEYISLPIVVGLSLATLLGVNYKYIISASYLIFGLIWTASCLKRIPLTAHYSCSDYGGEQAFANPLFVRTNRILTLLWGFLYILSGFWTYSILGTPLAPYIGLINTIVPGLMGMFTIFFQKWYPARWARGKGF